MGGLGAIGPGSGANLSRVLAGESLAPSGRAAAPAPLAEALGDSVASLFGELSANDVTKLMDLLGPALPPADAALLQDLVHAFVTAAAQGDAAAALQAMSGIAALDPGRPDLLRADPASQPVQASIDQFVNGHTALARLNAEGRLEQAAQQVNLPGPDRLAGWDMRPANMVALADRIFEAGGLQNYVHAAELAQVVVDNARWAPAPVPVPPADTEMDPLRLGRTGQPRSGTFRPGRSESSGRMQELVLRVWKRAPLLVLLLSWLLAGIAGGVGSWLWRSVSIETWPAYLAAFAFDVWGLGFIAIVGFGFYMRVRKPPQVRR